MLHAGGCFRSLGGLGVAQERARGQAEASPDVGGATRTLSVLTRRPSTRGHRRRPKAAAQRNFWLEGVESGQKSLPVRRHHVGSGAAARCCYKQAFAHGLGRKESAMMKKSEGDRSLRFRRHDRFFGKSISGKFGERFLATREFWYHAVPKHFGLIELRLVVLGPNDNGR